MSRVSHASLGGMMFAFITSSSSAQSRVSDGGSSCAIGVVVVLAGEKVGDVQTTSS